MLIKICTKSSKSLKNSTNYQPLSSIDLNMMVTSNKSSKDMVRSVETVKSYAEKEVNCKAAEALCQTMRAKVTNMDTWRNKPELVETISKASLEATHHDEAESRYAKIPQKIVEYR